VVKCTRRENQATQKAAFGFLRDNEQTVCGADEKREARVCEYSALERNDIL